MSGVQLLCCRHPATHGKLTNMIFDAKGMFVELEKVFRDTCPCATAQVNAADYKVVYYRNKVIQDCYFSSAFSLDSVLVKYLHCASSMKVEVKPVTTLINLVP